MKKTKNNGVIFQARDFAPNSFVMLKDGPKWKHNSERRRALYMQLASHGSIEWAGITALGKAVGLSRATTFRYMDDLYELGAVNDGKDESGHKYHGHRRTRVREISTCTLPVAATGWMDIPELGTLVRVVRMPKQESQLEHSGVSDSTQESQIESAGVSNRKAGVSNLSETEKNFLKELPKEQNQPLATVEREFLELQGTTVTFNDKQHEKLAAILEGYTAEEIRAAVYRATCTGAFNGLTHDREIAERLTDKLRQWLPVVRSEMSERARQVITPEMLEAKRLQVAAQFQSDSDELADARATLEATRGLLEPEQVTMLEAKILRLTTSIEEARRTRTTPGAEV